MLVYDITNEKSFDNIRNWIRNIEEVGHAQSHDPVMIRTRDGFVVCLPARVSGRGEDGSGEQVRHERQKTSVQGERREGRWPPEPHWSVNRKRFLSNFLSFAPSARHRLQHQVSGDQRKVQHQRGGGEYTCHPRHRKRSHPCLAPPPSDDSRHGRVKSLTPK